MNIKLSFLILFLPLFTIGQEVIISGEALYNTNFSLINGSIMGATIKSTKSSTKKSKSKISDLRFNRSEAESKKIQEDFITNLSKGQAGIKPSLIKVFSNNKLRNQFDALLKNYSYSSSNIADVLTAYSVISWQIVNDKSFNDNNGFNSVRKMIQDQLLKSDILANKSNAEKQLIAETYGYQTMLSFNSYKALMSNRDSQGLANLRNRIHRSLKDSFIDLMTVKLTHEGFIKN